MRVSPAAVSAIGVATPLGWTATQSCAAARAGIVRSTALDLKARDPESGGAEAVVGHTLAGVTDGFAGIGRYWRMAAPALDDLIDNSDLRPTPARDTALFLHIRDDFYGIVAAAPDPGVEESALREQAMELEAEEWSSFESAARDVLLQRLARRVGTNPSRQFLSTGGAPAFLRTLAKAMDSVDRGDAKRCIVGAVDSLLDGSVLDTLETLGLLKCGEKPTGLAPGECAAFLLIEPPAALGGRRPLALLEGVSYVDEGSHRFLGEVPTGEGLASAIRDSFAQAGRTPEPAVAIGNLNGDTYRVSDFANALVKLGMEKLPIDCTWWLPATSFGDTGAAAVPLAICLGVRAFARGYARGERILVWAGSDDGGRGSCLLRAHGAA